MSDANTFEIGLRKQGYSEFAIVNREEGYALGEHRHPFDACALIEQGSITLTVGEQTQVYGVGDVFELAAHTLHSEVVGKLGVVYFVGRRSVAT